MDQLLCKNFSDANAQALDFKNQLQSIYTENLFKPFNTFAWVYGVAGEAYDPRFGTHCIGFAEHIREQVLGFSPCEIQYAVNNTQRHYAVLVQNTSLSRRYLIDVYLSHRDIIELPDTVEPSYVLQSYPLTWEGDSSQIEVTLTAPDSLRLLRNWPYYQKTEYDLTRSFSGLDTRAVLESNIFNPRLRFLYLSVLAPDASQMYVIYYPFQSLQQLSVIDLNRVVLQVNDRPCLPHQQSYGSVLEQMADLMGCRSRELLDHVEGALKLYRELLAERPVRQYKYPPL